MRVIEQILHISPKSLIQINTDEEKNNKRKSLLAIIEPTDVIEKRTVYRSQSGFPETRF